MKLKDLTKPRRLMLHRLDKSEEGIDPIGSAEHVPLYALERLGLAEKRSATLGKLWRWRLTPAGVILVHVMDMTLDQYVDWINGCLEYTESRKQAVEPHLPVEHVTDS